MPCTITPEEERWYQKQSNKKNFGYEGTDSKLLTEVACRACTALQKAGLMKDQSELVQKWWKSHKEWDKTQGRNHDKE